MPTRLVPSSSSASATNTRSPDSAIPERAISASATARVAVSFFMSHAPRPHTYPASSSTPANGGCVQSPASAGTTSVWPSSISEGPEPLPGQSRHQIRPLGPASAEVARCCARRRKGSSDIMCLGKGLGGGVPISACIGTEAVMRAWRRESEVVHTSTFAGAPVACAAAIATLDVLSRERLVERSRERGARFLAALASELATVPGVAAVRGANKKIKDVLENRDLRSLLFFCTGGSLTRVQQRIRFSCPLTVAHEPEEVNQPTVA